MSDKEWFRITEEMPGIGRPVEVSPFSGGTKLHATLMMVNEIAMFVNQDSIVIADVAMWRYTASGSSGVSESVEQTMEIAGERQDPLSSSVADKLEESYGAKGRSQKYALKQDRRQ